MGGIAALVRTGAARGGLRCSVDSPVVSGARCQPLALAVSAPRSFHGLTSFSGQRLKRQSTNCPLKTPRSKTVVGKAHGHGPAAPPGPPSNIGAENILDDISRYIYMKLKALLAPYFPNDFDALGWLPEGIHRRLHNIEAPAIILLRELMHFALFYFLFIRVDTICKTLNWIYASNTEHKDDFEQCYDTSVFNAMTKPLRLLIVIWAGTRLCHVVAPLLKLKIELVSTGKIRAIGIVVAVTWFFFKWKALYVNKLVTDYKLDAPRIFAFDKVISLLMYFVAATSIGEVTGFALRSLLAVGGFSGVALGLAAKEIVSNFFGGALLFITRPFVIGESIKTGHFSGSVQDIGFLQTKIMSRERVPMIVPNQNFINQVITNYSRAVNRLMEAEFALRMQDIFLVDRITSRVVQYLRSHPDVDTTKSAPVCYLKICTASNNVIAVTCVLRSSGGMEFYKSQQAILVHIAGIIVSEGASMGSNAQFGVIVPSVASPEILASN